MNRTRMVMMMMMSSLTMQHTILKRSFTSAMASRALLQARKQPVSSSSRMMLSSAMTTFPTLSPSQKCRWSRSRFLTPMATRRTQFRSSTPLSLASSSLPAFFSSTTTKTTAGTAINNSKTKNAEKVPPISDRLRGLDQPTVWHEFSPLATQYGSINLGQGFPDWDPPEFAQQAMREAIDPVYGRHANQYARSYAHLPLAKVVADDYNVRWQNTGIPPIDAATQVATAVGCTNVLFCALQGMINPGDEVLLLEPAFDIYAAQVRMAAGVPVFCPLRPLAGADPTTTTASQMFTLDLDELASHITSRTKVMILNTPHNPTGKLFGLEELKGIAEIVRQHPQLVIIADEVYEHIIFDPVSEPHLSFAAVAPDLFDQTLTLSSAGKTLSCTGWKIGWGVGPVHLVQTIIAAQQWVNFSAPTPNQDAIAVSLIRARQPYEGFDTYYQYLANMYLRKRNLLLDAIRTAGMTPIVPMGGFFIMADTTDVEFPYDEIAQQITPAVPAIPMPRDWALSRWMTMQVGVTAIPPSAFYGPDTLHLAKNLLRFAYCEGDDTILQAHERFRRFFGKP